MAQYVYRTIDLKSNAVLEDIDLQKVQFSVKLSDVGDLTGDLFVPQTKRGLLLDSATFPGRTGLYVLRDGVPVWGGIIWKRDWDESTATFRLSCGSWESFAYHELQRSTLSYAATDQFQIAREILNANTIDVESGISWPTAGTSGVVRQRNMFPYEFKTVGLELEQLAGLDNGFDYTVQSYIQSDGSFGRRYLFGYPRLGRTASLTPSANSLTFDYPGNLAPFTLTEDAESSATRIYAIGSGEGTEMLSATATDSSFAANGWPRLDKVVQYKDVLIQATLNDHATEDLKNVTPPINAWSLRLAPDSDVKITDISIGDSAVFRISSRRWADPILMIRRITEITVSPGDQGEIEAVQLGIAEERT